MRDTDSPKTEDKGDGEANDSRRAFSRKAVVGAAAIVTLANRSAWGQGSIDPNCVSSNAWASFDGGTYTSLTGGVQDAIDKRAELIQRANDSDGELIFDSEDGCLKPPDA
jgi:hypothetical protein